MRYFAIIVCGMLSIGCDAGGLIIVEQIGDAGADATVDDCDAGAMVPNLDKDEPAMLSGCGGSMAAPLPTMTASPQSP